MARTSRKEKCYQMKKFFKGFKDFAMRGNVVDLAVGVMIGAAFGQIVTSIVNDLVMPLLGLILGRFNLKGAFIALDGNHYASVDAATAAGSGVLNYGNFITSVINFILMALVIYSIITLIQRMSPKKPEPSKTPPRLCPSCKSEVNKDATRCPFCTSYLTADGQPDKGTVIRTKA